MRERRGGTVELSFVRCECVGPSSGAVLDAVDQRVRALRARGWDVPRDASVRVRRSGFGFAAALVLPERLRRDGRWVLSHNARGISGVLPKVEIDDQAQTGIA